MPFANIEFLQLLDLRVGNFIEDKIRKVKVDDRLRIK